LNIPNILSIIRILLIPVFAYEFMYVENTIISGIILIVSGITDFLDGYIARKFNLVSNVGKILDPLADKLTQVVTVLCLALKGLPIMWILFALLVIKDLFLVFGGISLYKKQDMVVSSNWYGKLATIIFYVAIIFLVLFYRSVLIPFKNIIAGVIIGTMIVTFIGYISYFFAIRDKKF